MGTLTLVRSAVVVGMLLVALPARAQPLLASGAAQHHSVFMSTALEPEWVLSLGYLHRLDSSGPVGWSVGGGLKLLPLRLGSGAWRANLLASGGWVSESHWGATLSAQPYVAHDRNRAGAMTGLGVELRAAPGFHGPRWSGALDLGWQGTLLTRIQPSTELLETFQERYPEGTEGTPGPREGWYGSTAHRFRVGLVGARTLNEQWTLQLALGSLFFFQEQGLFVSFDFAQVPVYAEFSVQWSG